MTKKGKIYIALASLVIISIVIAEVLKPKPVNWFPSYTLHHKIPFGAYVFNEQLSRLSDEITRIDRPPFEYLRQNDIGGTYFFFNNGVQFGKQELNTLLDWTANGNTLIVSSINFEEKLLDTLHLSTRAISTLNNFNNEYQVQLINNNLDNTSTYKFDRASTFYHFNKIDSLNTKVVGLIDKYQSDEEKIQDSLVNIVKQPFGKGQIILSTFPQAFTNYFILNNPNQNYTADLMSYIDFSKPLYIDAHYKTGKTFYTSPMYLFLNTKSLKWAYYLVLIGAVIYIIFEGKRKQRAIPIVKPLKNQTLEFTRTISDMYYETGKHKDISHHKIQHFLEYIRNTVHLQTSNVDDTFIKNLAARSSNSIEDTKDLFKFINEIQHKNTLTSKELEHLNKKIEHFKSHNQWKTKT
ncbi:DUF4350 domain-containing protein [Winogradskyella immobilis]|uniref:DUF4350 domain-containing protein n=1 Tax=Winogradskyella immobilis TaxID=2816852 RepID=A0ABS8EPE0_9FLAO|nr:DUF4350 domain-containing protein [Winogradskyella immobilis]MCC1484980.1 DUF4350 domain-containing protein [Winogradskyella immobilis]MCG0017072.1 DUF4350 domain-containing protein [Winogradskyella immobilis]